jgi:outer membrane lipoprotein-sorting protein
MIKRPVFIVFVLLLFSLAGTVTVSAQDYHALLERADSLVSYTGSDFSARYTVVQQKPGQGRSTTVAAVFRRDAESMYVVIVLKPEINKGQGYLKKGGTLWFYDPESQRFNSTSASERFQNTNMRNSDFTKSTLADDYEVVQGDETTLGRYDCWLLTLRAVKEDVTYPRMKIWISKSDSLVRKTEDYSLSGQLLRTTAIPSYYEIEGKFVPKKILFIEELKGARIDGEFRHEKTQISIEQPSFDDIRDSVFSKTFLENVSR